MSDRKASRLAWSLWAVAIAFAGAAVALQLASLSAPIPPQFGFRGFSAVFALAFGTVGAVVASRRPENPIGWLFLTAGVLSGLQEFVTQYGAYGAVAHPGRLPLARDLAWVTAWIWVPITAMIVVYLFLLFPTGRLRSTGWRPVAWVAPVGIVIFGTGQALYPGPLSNLPALTNPFGSVVPRPLVNAATGVGAVIYFGCAAASLASLVIRFRGARGDERQQLKWFVSGAALVVLSLGLSFVPAVFSNGAIPKVLSVFVVLSFCTIPVVAGIGILKYRLYDIDIVINKAVVYAVIAVFITLVYVGLVVGIGTAIGNRGSVFLSAVAAALVALAFQPVRRRAQVFANRLVYGKRATPYEVLSEFSGRLAGTYSMDDVLPRMARIIGEGTSTSAVHVWLRVGAELRPVAIWPDGASTPEPVALADPGALPELAGAAESFAVRHQGELLGAITAMPASGEAFTPVQRKLVEDVSSQAGLVLQNVRLTAELRARLDEISEQAEELRASRQRIVAAQDEERRRLERNIHDGAQQQLVAIGIKLGLAKTLMERDPQKAVDLLEQLKAENQDSLETLRDLARGIYPPLLANQGLAAALSAQARKSPLPVQVDGDGLGRYPQDVEAAIYFASLEALQNVAKYANASRATIRLIAVEGNLAFEIADDGLGFDVAATPRGSGLTNMADRVAALDGRLWIESTPGHGTTIRGLVPVAGMRPD